MIIRQLLHNLLAGHRLVDSGEAVSIFYLVKLPHGSRTSAVYDLVLREFADRGTQLAKLVLFVSEWVLAQELARLLERNLDDVAFA